MRFQRSHALAGASPSALRQITDQIGRRRLLYWERWAPERCKRRDRPEPFTPPARHRRPFQLSQLCLRRVGRRNIRSNLPCCGVRASRLRSPYRSRFVTPLQPHPYRLVSTQNALDGLRLYRSRSARPYNRTVGASPCVTRLPLHGTGDVTKRACKR
jgi:hypothetical protein